MTEIESVLTLNDNFITASVAIFTRFKLLDIKKFVSAFFCKLKNHKVIKASMIL